MSERIDDIVGDVGEATDSFADQMDDIGENVSSSSGVGFFKKLGLMVIIIIIVVFVVRICIQLILNFLSPSESPYLVNGLAEGSVKQVIPQNPRNKKSKTVLRSKNQSDGLEFTYTTWLYIREGENNFDYKDKFRHIFSKGNSDVIGSNTKNLEYDTKIKNDHPINDGMVWPNASPGLYLHSDNNSLRVTMNTFEEIIEIVDVNNIPLNKWINVMIRVKGRVLDIYINGTIVNRHYLSGVPKQNYGNVYTGLNGGFNGYISCLRYFNYALEPGEIMGIVNKGPCLKKFKGDIQKESKNLSRIMPYISNRWYFDN